MDAIQITAVIDWCAEHLPDLPDIPMTEFARCVPEDCLHDDVVESYRIYYRKYKHKFAKWKLGTPEWYTLYIFENNYEDNHIQWI